MRKIIVSTFASLDGVMQAPGGPEEDPTRGFTEGGWSFSYWDDTMNAVMGESMGKPFDLLLGRKTYEIFAAHWPYAGDNPITAVFNKATKYVATHTLDKAELGQHQTPARATSRRKCFAPETLKATAPNCGYMAAANLPPADPHRRASGRPEYHVWIFPGAAGQGQTPVRGGHRAARPCALNARPRHRPPAC